MKKLLQKIVFLAVLITPCFVFGQDETIDQTMYIDFGPNDVTNGDETTGEDTNGNYWTNVTNALSSGGPITIVNTLDEETNISLQLETTFGKNGKNHGGLKTPEEEKLADLAIATATQDYFFTSGTCGIRLSGFDKDKQYRFTAFGSRGDGVPNRFTEYMFSGLNTEKGVLQTSFSFKGNTENVYTTGYIFPDAEGEIYFTVTKVSGLAYLNALKVEEITSDAEFNAVTAMVINPVDLTSPLLSRQIEYTIEPANATVNTIEWVVDNEMIATIDADGVIHPKRNGTITVTATSNDIGADLSEEFEMVIANQPENLYLTGSALDDDKDRLFNYSPDVDTLFSNIFYAYVPLIEGESFTLYNMNENQEQIAYGIDAEGTLVQDGDPITVTETAPYRVKIDFNTQSIVVEKITNWKLVGTQTPGSWGSSEGPEIEYQGGSIWQSTVTLQRDENETYDAMLLRMNDSYLMGSLWSNFSKLSYKDDEDIFGGIRNFPLPDGEYIFTLDLENYTYLVEAPAVDDMGIVFCGSSVCGGFGALTAEDGSYTGYAYNYTTLLEDRTANGIGKNWNVKNVSIGGDNTIKVNNRWDLDVASAGSKYLVIGLSMGNEGLMSGGQVVFDQFKENLTGLIQRARDEGMVPVIMSNYANGRYDETDYAFVKEMNLLIHQWDVPSMNLLGALDNGMGQFINNDDNEDKDYERDPAHPNQKGHDEFLYAMVPSLFDALYNEKPLPTRMMNSSLAMHDLSQLNNLNFTPDGTVHSFTNSVYFKTDSEGNLVTFTQGEVKGTLAVNADGFIAYTSPTGDELVGPTVVNDDEWHLLTLTHYYATEATFLYVDKEIQGAVSEQLVPEMFQLNNNAEATSLSFKEWFFYRAGMNKEEVDAIADGMMLKSSLELYAPLNSDVTSEEHVMNYAQSTVKIEIDADKTAQTIDFGAIESMTYGDTTYTLSATSSEGLPITYATSNEDVATIDGQTLTILGAGDVTITAMQEGANYIAEAVDVDQMVTIEKALIEVSTVAQSSIYGDTIPTFAIAYLGFVNNESSADLTTMATATTVATSSADAGEYEVTLSGATSDNYTFSYSASSITIEKALIEVSTLAQSSTYGGTIPTFTIAYSGFVNNESSADLSAMATATTVATNSSAVGEYEVTLSGATSDNYTFSYSASSITIEKALIEVSTVAQSSIYGDTIPTFTITYLGFVNDESSADLSAMATATTVATSSSTVGEYEVTLSGATSDNYTFSYSASSITIEKAQIEVSTVALSSTYGNDIPTFTIAYSGFVNNESSADLTTMATATTVATSSADAGEYEVTLSGATADNYSFSYFASTLTINKAAQEITLFDLPESIALSTESFILISVSSAALEVSYSSSDESILSIDGVTATLLKAGEVEITATQAGNKNYEAAAGITQTITVTVEEEEEEEPIDGEVTALEDDLLKINIYPNPTANFFTLDQDAISIQVYNLNGVMVKTFEGVKKQYDISNLPKSTYALLIQTVEGVQTQKLLIK
ncbi:T9SS type A sorting domain-containing protein [Flammeovirga pectinis]|uniref:T9SS type A sorting domain-containing protein n=1 Tax=Flammeovirga pectinis TaxID=2494373 RepID=A0A3Q9FSM8_9BACT|nr:MBG domain-containing protein [Flammeovirga pectinis]AZQ65033.1 T9SS type A sorting domain-containing protein [Flammeovirga pectinis]